LTDLKALFLKRVVLSISNTISSYLSSDQATKTKHSFLRRTLISCAGRRRRFQSWSVL